MVRILHFGNYSPRRQILRKPVGVNECLEVLRKQRLECPKNVIFGHLNISLRNKFVSISELIKGKVVIFLINKTKLYESFPSNQFAMSRYKFIRRDRSRFGRGIDF